MGDSVAKFISLLRASYSWLLNLNSLVNVQVNDCHQERIMKLILRKPRLFADGRSMVIFLSVSKCFPIVEMKVKKR